MLRGSSQTFANHKLRQFCADCGAALDSACNVCGFPNERGDKYCGGCGARLVSILCAGESRSDGSCRSTAQRRVDKMIRSKSALEGERKLVTVLFADMKDSMELLAHRDPEEARRLLDPALQIMMEAVHRYSGTVNQVMGDGIMSLFGAPLALESHAVRACYAALWMQQAMGRYSEEVTEEFGVPIQIRVGLSSGVVVVRSIESDLHMDYTAVGKTTHVAARMEQMAKPGAILMAGETFRLVRDQVGAKPLGPVRIKGLDDPLDVYEIVGPQRDRQAGRVYNTASCPSVALRMA